MHQRYDQPTERPTHRLIDRPTGRPTDQPTAGIAVVEQGQTGESDRRLGKSQLVECPFAPLCLPEKTNAGEKIEDLTFPGFADDRSPKDHSLHGIARRGALQHQPASSDLPCDFGVMTVYHQSSLQDVVRCLALPSHQFTCNRGSI